MPYINLKLVGKLSKDQKEKIAKEFSETLLKVAGKPKESLYLVIDEVNGENHPPYFLPLRSSWRVSGLFCGGMRRRLPTFFWSQISN